MSEKSAKKTTAQPRYMHLVMQGKGGVGKSFCSSLIAQYLASKKEDYVAYDLDPINKTLSAVTALRVKSWAVLRSATVPEIDPRRFDDLIEDICAGAGHVVLDTGATVFLAFNRYLLSCELLPALREQGIETIIHVVLRGGSATQDCLNNLVQIMDNYPAEHAQVIVWQNEVEGPITRGGTKFEDMQVYTEYQDRIQGLITLDEVTDDLLRTDITRMQENYWTLHEAQTSSDAPMVSKLRYRALAKTYFETLDSIVPF